MRKYQQGFSSLIEMMCVLVIIAILLVLSILYYQTVSQAHKVTATFTSMNAVYKASIEAVQDSTWCCSVDASANMLADDGYLAVKYATNPWGAWLMFGPAGTSTNVMMVSSGPMPKAACNKLYQRLSSASLQDKVNESGNPSACVKGKAGYSTSISFTIP